MNSFFGSLTKYGLIVFNFICLIFGLLLIIFGALARSPSNYTVVSNVGQGPATGSIVIGVLIFVICFLGCCGAIKESRFMLLTFGTIVFLLIIVEFTIGGLLYKYRDEIIDISTDSFKQKLSHYGNDTEFTHTVDSLQKELHCCGAKGPEDWDESRMTPNLPSSCCAEGKGPCSKQNAYRKGCVDAVKDQLVPAFKVLAITVILLACFQILGVFGSCCVASCIKRAQYEHC